MLQRAKSFIQRRKHDEDKELPESSHLKRRGSIKVVKQHREPSNAKIEVTRTDQGFSRIQSRSQENLRHKPPVPKPKVSANSEPRPVTKGVVTGEFKSWPHKGKSSSSGIIMRSNPLYRSERSALKQPTQKKSSANEPPWKPPNTFQELVTSINELYIEESSKNSRNPVASTKTASMDTKRFYQTEF